MIDMSNALIIIDVQKGFVNEYSKHIIHKLINLIQDNKFEYLIFSQFINTEDSPYRMLMGWERLKESPEIDIVDELKEYAINVFQKNKYSMFTQEFENFLKQKNIKELYFTGIDTDICVLKNAVDAFEKGYTPYVLADYCASHYGDEYHQIGLKLIKKFIGEKQVIYGEFRIDNEKS